MLTLRATRPQPLLLLSQLFSLTFPFSVFVSSLPRRHVHIFRSLTMTLNPLEAPWLRPGLVCEKLRLVGEGGTRREPWVGEKVFSLTCLCVWVCASLLSVLSRLKCSFSIDGSMWEVCRISWRGGCFLVDRIYEIEWVFCGWKLMFAMTLFLLRCGRSFPSPWKAFPNTVDRTYYFLASSPLLRHSNNF